MSTLIKDLPTSEKPREKFLNYGVKSLSDAELIAIILRSGTKDISVKDLAINITKRIGNISNYDNLTINYLKNIKGMGEVKAITLLSAIELGRRTLMYEKKKSITISNPKIIYDLFKYEFLNDKQEHLIAIFLDTKKQIIACKEVFRGTVNTIITHPREIFKEAIKYAAVSIILAHNHPSGHTNPSKEDRDFTQKMLRASKLLDIPLIDHVIIGDNNYYSFYEKGW